MERELAQMVRSRRFPVRRSARARTQQRVWLKALLLFRRPLVRRAEERAAHGGPFLDRPRNDQLTGADWKAEPHFFGLYELMSPVTSEPLLQLSARLPLPVIVSLAANLSVERVLRRMPSPVLLLMVFPPRLLKVELRSINTPLPVL